MLHFVLFELHFYSTFCTFFGLFGKNEESLSKYVNPPRHFEQNISVIEYSQQNISVIVLKQNIVNRIGKPKTDCKITIIFGQLLFFQRLNIEY